MRRATVLGASGFIGGRLATRLRTSGYEVLLPDRGDAKLAKNVSGTVFYCIGLTADFRSQPFATMDAHVGVLRTILERGGFDRLIYLSSTRVYAGCEAGDEEQALRVLPSRREDLYNLSKMAGESLALASGRHCHVARLSNVLGPGMGSTNFVGSLVDEAKLTGAVRFHTSPASDKDYLWIDDAVEGLVAVAERGIAPIYNLAGGSPISNRTLADLLAAQRIAVSFSPGAPTTTFPSISIARLEHDTGFRPGPVLPKLAAWLQSEMSS